MHPSVMRESAVAVMCRVPRGGAGKSRLRVRHEASFVEALQEAMLRDTLASLETLGAGKQVLFVAPLPIGDACAQMASEARGWEVRPQEGDGLGARILHVFRSLFAEGARRVLVTGSDAPSLSVPASALSELEEREVLLVPSDDGGYAAIALRRLELAIFEGIPWSTGAVAEATRARARACGLVLRELPATFDVDEPEDVERLRAELAAAPSRAPRTAAVLLAESGRGAQREA